MTAEKQKVGTLLCVVYAVCQSQARQLKPDKVPISIVEKAGQGHAFEHMHCDVFGPILHY